MKHFTQNLKWLLLSMMLVVGVGSALGATMTDTYTFTSKSWAASPSNWTSGKDGNQLTSGQGVQVTTGVTGANATSPTSYTNVTKIVVTYCTNASKGAGSIAIQVGSNTALSQNVTTNGGTTLRTLEYTPVSAQSGNVKLTVTCTTNSIYINSIAITYDGGTPKTDSEVTFPQESYSTSYPGSFSAPTATVSNASTHAAISGATVTYSSNNSTVASVNSSNGAVTLNGAGTAVITATYAGNSTYNGSSGSYTLNVADGRTATSMTFPSSSYEAILGESFTSPAATLSPSAAGSITYSSNNSSVATVNSSSGEITLAGVGTAIITATFEGNANYKGSSAAYTLTVASASGGSSFTWDLKTDSYSSASATQVVWNSTYATMTLDKSTSGTNANNYLGGDANNRTSSRFYKDQQLTIAPASGYKIKSIEFVATTANYATTFGGSTWTNATASVSGTTVTVTPTLGISDVIAKIDGTCGFTGVTVYYELSDGNTPDAPSLTPSCTFWPKTTETPSMTVTIAPTSTGSTVRYTTDGSVPSTTNGHIVTNSTDITITETTTVKAIAYVGNSTSGISSSTYTVGETVNSIAAFKELPEGTEARLYLSPDNNARVLHAFSSEIYVRDNTGAMCFYLATSLQNPVPQHDWHVAGWIIGKYQPYKGLPEFVATSNTTTDYLAIAAPVTEEATEPVTISPNDFDYYKADWVKICDLRTESTESNNNVSYVTDDAGNTFKFYNKYNLDSDSYYQNLYDYALVDLAGLAVPFGTDKEIVPIYYNNKRPIIYVIDENKSFTSPGNDIYNVTVRLVRTLSAENWNTFCIPFNLQDFDGSVRKYEHADGQTMVFVEDYIEAGKPYLVKPNEPIENPVYENITLTATFPQNVEEGIYSFNGIYEPTNIYTVDRTRLFLKTDGYLYYPLEESKGRLKGMRAYFVAPAGSSGVKVMVDDDFSTMIEAIPDDIIPTVSDVYTISGQHLGNSLEGLPKGVYIVNGKKMLIK